MINMQEEMHVVCDFFVLLQKEATNEINNQ